MSIIQEASLGASFYINKVLPNGSKLLKHAIRVGLWCMLIHMKELENIWLYQRIFFTFLAVNGLDIYTVFSRDYLICDQCTPTRTRRAPGTCPAHTGVSCRPSGRRLPENGHSRTCRGRGQHVRVCISCLCGGSCPELSPYSPVCRPISTLQLSSGKMCNQFLLSIISSDHSMCWYCR